MRPLIPHRSARLRPAFTWVEVAVVLVIIALLIAILIPALGTRNRGAATGFRQSSQVRGIHQSMVIFAQNNGGWLPGLDKTGKPLPANDPLFSSAPTNLTTGLTGVSMAARYYILLNGSFVAGDLLISPQDVLTKWSDSAAFPTTDQFSYSLLRIGDSPTASDVSSQADRAVEWHDNANSQAILISDRNTAPTATSDKVRSVWSMSPGSQADWKGTVLWGDNHAEFLNAPNARLGTLSLSTKYGKTINSDDFLFSSDAASSSRGGKSPTASAMFGYTSANF